MTVACVIFCQYFSVFVVMFHVKTGDLVTIESTGAYCASMSTKNYNSFPEAAEVLLDNGALHLIRRYVMIVPRTLKSVSVAVVRLLFCGL